MSTQITNEDLELSVLETDAAETPTAAQGVASGLSEPRAGLMITPATWCSRSERST